MVSDDWLVLWLSGLTAGCEAVSLIVVGLSAWMICWCCRCLGGRAVGLDGEDGREALSLDGWLVLWLSGRFSGGWPVNLDGLLVRGLAVCSVGWLVVELAAVMVVWGSACLLEGLYVACIVGGGEAVSLDDSGEASCWGVDW